MAEDLPVPVCPAARPLAGPPVGGPSLVCGVLSRERSLADQITAGTYSSGFLAAETDPTAYFGFCCSPGLPVVDSVPDGGHASYTCCPIWRGEKERIAAGKERGMEPAPRVPPLGMDDPRNAATPDELEELKDEMARTERMQYQLERAVGHS